MKQTIQNILKGDKKAYKAVVKEFGPGIRAFFAGHLNDFSEVDDLSQEVFISAYENLKTFNINSDFKTWLKGIARNKLNMHLRHEYTKKRIIGQLKNRVADMAPDEESGYSTFSPREAIYKLRECLKKLPEKFKRIVDFRYIQNSHVKTIAEKLAMTVSAVSVILFRSRKMLESCMREDKPNG
jgi:RNA polymerase sigma-70 factor (ECF subfamily)